MENVQSEDEALKAKKEKIRSYIKGRNLFLIGLIAFLVIFRLYYFFYLGEQPIWWDEGDYLAIAKVWALGTPQPEWWGHFTGIRPLFLPLVWTALFKIGLSEFFIRFLTILLPSVLSVLLVYLIGRDLYDKNIGIIASFMMSVYWVFTFYSYRLLTDVPATFFGLLSIYFFWIYIKKEKPLGLYLCFLFGVLGFSTRFPIALTTITCVIYLIFVRRFSIIKDKTIWKSLVLLIIFISPYIFYFFSTNFSLFQMYFGETAISIKQPIQWNIIPMTFSFLESFWQISLVIGLLVLIHFFALGFSNFWKQQDKKLNSDFFVILWIVVQLIFYIVIIRGANDRWLLILMPPLFYIAAKGIMFSYDFIKKYSKPFALIVLIILLFGGVYQNFNHSIDLIETKKASYKEIRDAGLWLKDNSPQNSKIITASIVQNQYYSERDSYDFYGNITLPKGCIDLYGQTVDNESCQKASEDAFNEEIKIIKPDYLIASVFEPVFTPKWVYSYGQRYNLTLVKAFVSPQNPNQAMLIVYKF